MSTEYSVKHICNRCGTSVEMESGGFKDPLNQRGRFPSTWQHIQLGQTGAQLDLCDECNAKLVIWLGEEGASNMKEACINEREVL